MKVAFPLKSMRTNCPYCQCLSATVPGTETKLLFQKARVASRDQTVFLCKLLLALALVAAGCLLALDGRPYLMVPGFILLVPPFVSYFRTGARIVRMEENAGIQKTVEPVLGLIAALVYSLHVVYYQSHLNKIWE